MIICFQCHKKIEGNGILISEDDDFVCDETCNKNYEKEKNYFFNVIVQNEKKCENWLLGKQE